MGSVSDSIAAQLSAAAYGQAATPAGWTKGETVTTADGANSFTVFTNGNTASIAFKGSDNLSNFQSDIGNSGGSAWEAIKPLAQNALSTLLEGGYDVFTTGHSLGGGMAQTFALENNISGYGQNSLPISQTAISTDLSGGVTQAISSWKNSGNTFSEVNVSGDPATLYYSTLQGQQYLSTSTTTLASSYASCEATGLALTLTPLAYAGAAMVADCAAKAHSINTVVSDLASPGTTTGDTSAVDSSLQSNASAISSAFSSATLSGSDSNITATAGNGQQINVTALTESANSDAYSIAISGSAAQAYDVVTGAGGAAFNQDGAVLDLYNNTSAVINGSNNNVVAGAGASVTVGGNGSTSAAIDTVNATNANVQIEDNSRVNVFDSGGNVTSGQSDNFGAYGSNITVSANSSSGVWVGANGTSGAADTVNSGGATVTEVDGSNVTVNGPSASLGTIYVEGTDQLIANGSAGVINVQGNDSTVSEYGSNVRNNVTGVSDITNAYGTGDQTFNYGDGDRTNDYGSQDYNYNEGSDEIGWGANDNDSNYNANSSDTGQGNYNGGYDGGGGSGGYYGYYGYYGFAGKGSVAGASDSNIGTIAEYDKSHGDLSGASVAQKAREQVESAIASGAQSVLTGSQWDSKIITWSVAAPGGKISNALDEKEEVAAKAALATWAAASGLTFKEVADSSQADIRIGLGDFDTANSGVAGFTTYRSQDGVIQAGALIRVEDPSQDSLTSGTDGHLVYGGTDASFTQVLMHEIGHALGLADNADLHSIESAYLGNLNGTLDGNDVSTIKALYSSPDVTRQRQSVDQLVQAMSDFAPSSLSGTSIAANDEFMQAPRVFSAHRSSL